MSRPQPGHIESPRLYLVPATSELTRADLTGATALSLALGIPEPTSWPPELYTRPALEAVLVQLQDRAEHGWSTWYLVGRGRGEGVLGVCGFKGRPDAQGSVEISYSILPDHRGIGLASEAVTRLVAWAFEHQNVNEVSAETLPYLVQSIRVLEKNGFQRAGAGSEYGVVRYALARRSLA